MEFFIDTANLEDINESLSWGVISGCTTNPIIVAKEKADFETRMKEILEIVDGPVSIEVTTNDTKEMIKEAQEFVKWGKNVVIKIPMGIPGLKATKVLAEKGIKTNVTACMSLKQVVLAAKAGATYVSLFWGRIEDMGHNAQQVVSNAVDTFERHNFKTKIIVGSFRQTAQVTQAILTGAHVLTLPPKVLNDMAWHPRTESTIKEFLDFWEEHKKVQSLK